MLLTVRFLIAAPTKYRFFVVDGPIRIRGGKQVYTPMNLAFGLPSAADEG